MTRMFQSAPVFVLIACSAAFGQPPGGRPDDPPPRRTPVERELRAGPPGKWWDNPEMAQKLGMSSDQRKRMDDVFQQNRLKLIDLTANLQREEAVLDPLVQADQPDDARILNQIDKVVMARAELEKAHARLLLALRHVLTPEQWRKLQLEDPGGPPPPRPRR